MDFKQIIEKNRKNVQKVIKLITNENNEDIEQKVYIKAWQKSSEYNEQGKITGWLGTIAKNLSKDFVKSKKDIIQDDEEKMINIADKADNPESALIRKERQKQIVKAINSLKPKLKEVIMMYEIDGFSYEYIAKTLNCPIGTVKSRLYNAKSELANKLSDLM